MHQLTENSHRIWDESVASSLDAEQFDKLSSIYYGTDECMVTGSTQCIAAHILPNRTGIKSVLTGFSDDEYVEPFSISSHRNSLLLSEKLKSFFDSLNATTIYDPFKKHYKVLSSS